MLGLDQAIHRWKSWVCVAGHDPILLQVQLLHYFTVLILHVLKTWSFFFCFPLYPLCLLPLPVYLWWTVSEETSVAIKGRTRHSHLIRSLIKWTRHYEWVAEKVIQWESSGELCQFVLLCIEYMILIFSVQLTKPSELMPFESAWLVNC